MTDLAAYNRALSDDIRNALKEWDAARPRSVQRSLGPSALGSCRELLRATIAGDPMDTDPRFNWKAFVGTAVGDLTETALKTTRGAVTQRRVTTVLPSGIKVSGSLDALIGRKTLIDAKGKNGLDTVIADGPSLANKIQLACYFVGLVQAGEMDVDGIASLVYQDRSGVAEYPWVWSMTYEQAQSWLEVADDRLRDVQHALASGQSQGNLRDEDEPWCFYTHCPFYSQCWPGDEFQPTEKITSQRSLDAMRRYDLGRELEKAAKQMKEEAKEELGGYTENPVTGRSEDFTLQWKLYEGRDGRVYQRIDQRHVRGRKPASPSIRVVDRRIEVSEQS